MTVKTTKPKAKHVTLEGIYQITQIIAFVAIIASLIAIYVQINQATKMERATAEREVLHRVSDYITGWEAEEADLFLLGLHDWDAAPFKARFTVDIKVSEYIQLSSATFLMHQDGFISESTLSGNDTYLISILRTPGGQKYWAYKQHRVGIEYPAYLNARMDALGESFPDIFEAEPHLAERLNEILAAQDSPAPVDIDRPDAEPAE